MTVVDTTERPSERPAVLTVAEAADALGMHKQTAYRLIRNNTFPVRVITIGGRLKVLRSDLDRFLTGEHVACAVRRATAAAAAEVTDRYQR